MSEEVLQPREPTPSPEPVSASKKFSDSFTANRKRLYINNVSYKATEDDIYDLLKDFEVLSVLIPSQTIRGLKLIQQKSLGIAFVDFNTERDAENAKVEINGKLLYDRPLRAKSFVPYQPEVQVSVLKPSRRHSLFHRKFIKEVEKEEEATSALESAPFDAKVPEETEETTEIVEETVEHEEKEIEDDEVKPGPPPRPVSNNTVFIGHLSPRITDGDLRSFFHDYSPTNIYLFKRRAPKNKPFFKHRHVSGLVTLEVEDLSKVLEDMSDSKLKGRRVTLKPAYLTKIEEVKRAADVRQRILEKLGQEARDADSGALTASTEGVDSPKVSSEVASGQEQSSSPKAEDEAESEANSGEITKH